MLRRVSSAVLFFGFVCSIPSLGNSQTSEVTEEYLNQLDPVAQKEARGCCSELLTGINANTLWGCSHYKVEQVCTQEQIDEALQENKNEDKEQENTADKSPGIDPNSNNKNIDSYPRGTVRAPNADKQQRSSAKESCNREERAHLEAVKSHKELSNGLNDRLLQLEELRKENNQLIASARKSLGVSLVGHLIGLPTSWAGNLFNIVQEFLGKEFSDAALQGADNFMQARRNLANKIQHNKDQFVIMKARVEQAQKDRERLKKLFDECRAKQ